MEIKINKEIRNYTESLFFGLSIRQTIFSLIAVVIAVLLFFLLKDFMSFEVLSWIVIIAAFPFALLGFVTYNGMTAEQFFVAWLKQLLLPKKLVFHSENVYEKLFEMNVERPKEKRSFLKKLINKIKQTSDNGCQKLNFAEKEKINDKNINNL